MAVVYSWYILYIFLSLVCFDVLEGRPAVAFVRKWDETVTQNDILFELGALCG